MKLRAQRQNLARSILAIGLASVMSVGSALTVAALQTADEASTQHITEDGLTTKSENELSSGDLMLTSSNNFELSVDVIKANSVIVKYNGKEELVMVARGTVKDALEKTEFNFGESTAVVPSEDTEIEGDMTVNVYDGCEVTVTSDGNTKNVIAPLGTVKESLDSLGYEIGDDDILSVSRSEQITENMKITVKRVTYREETSKEKINYDTVKKQSDSLELGETKVKTKGVCGERVITKKCKYVDGKKTDEEVIGTKVTKEPVDKVVLIGSKGVSGTVVGTFTDCNGVTVGYSRVVTGSGTAYCESPGSLTATGVAVYRGGVAVNPNVIPYGSKLYIVADDGYVYGYATAVDTGGALMAGTAVVDCFYDTEAECEVFGRRNVKVYVLS